jgi:hypothetical protein
MDKFNYLLVIVGIIIGLGLSQILIGLVDYIQNRHRVRLSGIQLAWMFMLFLEQLEYWYSLYSAESFGKNFATFLGCLLYPTFMFLATGILVPKVRDQGVLNLPDCYYETHRWFFGACSLGMLALICSPVLVYGQPWPSLSGLFSGENMYRMLGLVLLLTLMVFSSEIIHRTLTLLALITLVSFIVHHTIGNL